ncbi:hypothetical protein A2U01_0108564, partial [Trifolium medium]|nr:hypothetical protein [Trifolium medium]
AVPELGEHVLVLPSTPGAAHSEPGADTVHRVDFG